MNIQKLQSTILESLQDIKAQNTKIFNTSYMTVLFDFIIITSGNSNRQNQALSLNVSTRVKKIGGKVLSIEGHNSGEWILIDCSNIIVHIMQPTLRQYYNLEEIWEVK